MLYETPTTVDFKPQIYVDIRGSLDEKVKALSLHKSVEEVEFASDAIRCLAMYRAYQIRLLDGKVEAFQAVRWMLNPLLNEPNIKWLQSK